MADSSIKGISQEQVAEWKAKYGELFLITFGEEQFVYRPLKRFEYKTIMNNPDANRAFNEEKIMQMCVVHPAIDATKMPALKAGTVATVVELIMSASNFGVSEEPVKL
jgi:hypothetical protein